MPERRRDMPNAIRFHKSGGPEVLVSEAVPIGKPGPGEARVRHTAVGVNFVDIYIRTGLYPAALPSGLGTEAAGVIEAGGPLGAYSDVRVMPAGRLVALRQGISDQQAAAMMLKGLTVQYLIRQIHKVNKGDTILFHAAAGGVGLIACQWAKSLGATVIGTVGSEEKAKVAKAHGCDYPVIYTREDFVARVKEITRDQKLPVVYDSVGKDTFMKSLDCLKPKGMMVSFGQSSGSVGPIDLGIFGQKGSLFFTRPTLNTYAAARADLSAMAKDLFGVVLSGAVKIEIKQTYPLKEAAQAQTWSRARPWARRCSRCERSNPPALSDRPWFRALGRLVILPGRANRPDGIFGNHKSEDAPLRRALP